MTKQLRLALGILVTVTTVGLFYIYITRHPSLLHQLAATSPSAILTLLVLFGFWFCALAVILHASLRICNLELPAGENLILNAYSTFLNYFLPGQGGPLLRGLYLRGRYNLRFRHYLFSTLIYYVFYAAVSMLLLVGGVRAWWQTLIGVLVISLGAYLGARQYARKRQLSRRGLNFSLENLAYLALATCFQAICQVAIYWVELNSLTAGLKIGQVMSYTGAANFALFVNFTPGAVGIRETFLIFSQHLHHITNAAIVGANVLDRSTYIIFLGVVFGGLLLARGKAIFSFKSEVKHAAELAEASPAVDGGPVKAPLTKAS